MKTLFLIWTLAIQLLDSVGASATDHGLFNPHTAKKMSSETIPRKDAQYKTPDSDDSGVTQPATSSHFEPSCTGPDPGWTTLLHNDLNDGTWQNLLQGGPHVNLNHKDNDYMHTCGSSGGANGSVRLVGDQGMASSVILPLSPSLVSDMESYDDVRLRFWSYARRFSSPGSGKTERSLVEYCADLDGNAVNAATGAEVPCQSAGGWMVLAEFFNGQQFENDQASVHAVTGVPKGGTKPHLRLRMDAGGSGDYLKLYLDSIEVQGFITSDPQLQYVWDDDCAGVPGYDPATGACPGSSPLNVCEGDCDIDDECSGVLMCYQRFDEDETVPGCTGEAHDTKDYCFEPSVHTGNLPLKFIGDGLSSYGACEGDCDRDSECPTDFLCFKRGGTGNAHNKARVPGCDGTGISGEDYCSLPPDDPGDSSLGPTATPTACPQLPDITSQPTGPVSFKPGEKTALSDDGHVELSTGLIAKVIATAGSPVDLAGGGQSIEDFHRRPDGAAVFPDECGGWAYVSNSEVGDASTYDGGVGAIYFNAVGEVTGYKRIQKNTRRNCSGGKTWWGTWVTCEECGSTGGVYEVHPKGHPNGDATLKRKTLLGRRNGRSGGNYEGTAYYNPSPTDPNVRPAFYLTEDATSGPLERFRPSQQVLAEAIANNDFHRLLHDNPDGTATTDYLNIITWETNDSHLTHYGTFNWSSDYSVGAANANQYFQKCEGIDVRNRMLYMTCKRNEQFFILDLEARTYVESHTDGRTVNNNGDDVSRSGPFTGQPDQIRAILNGNDELVYFCEDVGDKAGIHAKDSTGQFYTIAQDEGGFHSGETTGLAFSPGHKHMYAAYQSEGVIYDITRADGRAFGGETLAIQYHGMYNGGNDEFDSRLLRKAMKSVKESWWRSLSK